MLANRVEENTITDFFTEEGDPNVMDHVEGFENVLHGHISSKIQKGCREFMLLILHNGDSLVQNIKPQDQECANSIYPATCSR